MNSLKQIQASPQGVAVQVAQLQRVYGARAVLQDISLQLAPGEVLALLGPSGCGKTTLLKILAGLEQPSAGTVHWGDQLVASAQMSLASEKRDLGMVFQDYALWPHMTVQANVAFPLRMRGVARDQVQGRVDETLAQVGLAGMGERLPSSLSGGQQQRVALARAIVAKPRLLLFDEPLSNLDRDLRESLCLEMSQLLRTLGCTAVYVTHDHEEACVMADRVAVMKHGLIQQLDAPQTLWSAPANSEVAEFLKLGAMVEAHRDGMGWRIAQQHLPRAASGQALHATAPWADDESAHQAQVLIPHGAVQLGAHAGPHMLHFSGQVLSQQYRCGQFHTLVHTEWDVPVQLASPQALPLRSNVSLSLDTQRLRWFHPGAPSHSLTAPADTAGVHSAVATAASAEQAAGALV